MNNAAISFSPTGPPETVLDPEPPEALAQLAEALGWPAETRHGRLSQVVARNPGFLEAWARLGEVARDTTEAYACFRVAYHRGLDRLRASGWRGSGYVRWVHPENRGFLAALEGLATVAAALGEGDEAQRCRQFLAQLDPDRAAELYDS